SNKSVRIRVKLRPATVVLFGIIWERRHHNANVAESIGCTSWVLGDEAEARELKHVDGNLGEQVVLEADSA
ncbi:hypothetical protein E4U14_003313, partial [Claviceps sp. LM454 group G7]